jgi:hypothetical protein
MTRAARGDRQICTVNGVNTAVRGFPTFLVRI